MLLGQQKCTILFNKQRDFSNECNYRSVVMTDIMRGEFAAQVSAQSLWIKSLLSFSV
jgi:hypothetical protein